MSREVGQVRVRMSVTKRPQSSCYHHARRLRSHGIRSRTLLSGGSPQSILSSRRSRRRSCCARPKHGTQQQQRPPTMSPNATPMRKPLTIFSPDEPPPMSSSTRSRRSMSPGRVSRLADIAAGEAPVVTVVGVVVLLPARVVVLTVEACIVRPSAGLPRL